MDGVCRAGLVNLWRFGKSEVLDEVMEAPLFTHTLSCYVFPFDCVYRKKSFILKFRNFFGHSRILPSRNISAKFVIRFTNSQQIKVMSEAEFFPLIVKFSIEFIMRPER